MGHLDHLDAVFARKFLLCRRWYIYDTHMRLQVYADTCVVFCAFLQWMLPHLRASETDTITTTISHTFAEYNTIITIYIIGPVSLLFLFRVNRTLRDNKLSQHTRKLVLILLLSVQYTTLVVVRYDTIRGWVHYLFTSLTFLFLLLYHGIVSNTRTNYYVDLSKPIFACSSVVLMFGFGGLVFFFQDLKNNFVVWTLCCFLEIAALLCLGALDIFDIYLLGLEMET